jgi:uncharacterized membrane protein
VDRRSSPDAAARVGVGSRDTSVLPVGERARYRAGSYALPAATGAARATDGDRTGVTTRRGTNPLWSFRWYRRSRLWVVPGLGVGLALVLAVVTLGVDRTLIGDEPPFPVFWGQADTARSILSLIGTSIATLTALVLTIVSVVLQLATQSLSPRAVRTFLQDARSHLTIGVFVTTFTYALVVLQQLGRIRDADADLVGSLSVTTAFVLAVVSIGMFISYTDHIIHQARVTSVLERIADHTREEIDRSYPPADRAGEPVHGRLPSGGVTQVVHAPRPGFVLEIDVAKLLDVIATEDVVVALVPAVGDHIPSDGRLLEVHRRDGGDVDTAALAATVEIDAERSIAQDVAFGFRLLVDVAERALSPGVNDPTTATQAIDHLHDLLRQLGTRPWPTGWSADDDGVPRLVMPQPSWDVLVALAFEEIRTYGHGSVQVMRRLRHALLDLLDEVEPERRSALHRQLQLLDAAVDEGFSTDLERDAARHPDPQGVGSGEGFAAAVEHGGRDEGPTRARQEEPT